MAGPTVSELCLGPVRIVGGMELLVVKPVPVRVWGAHQPTGSAQGKAPCPPLSS